MPSLQANIKMFKPSVRLAGLILGVGIASSPQLLLAADPVALPKPSSSSISTAQTTQPIRLELKLSRRRVTLYRGATPVKSYPVAVGRSGWETPTGRFIVTNKIRNPAWAHPLKKNVVIPGGDPENPLGRHWIGFWTDGKNVIGFHGTPTPKSVGRAASHGCVRMYNKDIAELFPQVTPGTPVIVVQ